MFRVATASKDFDDPLIGSRLLNALGLHGARIRLAQAATRLRGLTAPAPRDGAAAALRRDGVVVIRELLPPDRFRALCAEAEAAVARAARDRPLSDGTEPGFGARRPAAWGFDRADGATQNRFLTIGPQTPEAMAAARDPRLSALSRAAVGRRFPPHRASIYLTRHGDGPADAQKTLHRDTFHPSLKFWYFLRPVTPAEGPFAYVPGSHRATAARLAWENARAREMAARPRGQRHGAFRITEEELRELGLPPPQGLPVPANTLVLADTFGFHRRGDAAPGAERLAIYGALRPSPFLPV